MEFQVTHIIMPIGSVIRVTALVIPMPTSSIIICFARNTTRTLWLFHWSFYILTNQTLRYLASVGACIFNTRCGNNKVFDKYNNQ